MSMAFRVRRFERPAHALHKQGNVRGSCRPTRPAGAAGADPQTSHQYRHEGVARIVSWVVVRIDYTLTVLASNEPVRAI